MEDLALPLIQGQSTSLDQLAQQQLALWLDKTACVYEHSDPQSQIAIAAQRDQMRTSSAQASNTEVWVARYSGDQWLGKIRHFGASAPNPAGDSVTPSRVNIRSDVLVVGELLGFVVGGDSDVLTRYGFSTVIDEIEFLHRIWPSSPDPVAFPPVGDDPLPPKPLAQRDLTEDGIVIQFLGVNRYLGRFQVISLRFVVWCWFAAAGLCAAAASVQLVYLGLVPSMQTSVLTSASWAYSGLRLLSTVPILLSELAGILLFCIPGLSYVPSDGESKTLREQARSGFRRIIHSRPAHLAVIGFVAMWVGLLLQKYATGAWQALGLVPLVVATVALRRLHHASRRIVHASERQPFLSDPAHVHYSPSAGHVARYRECWMDPAKIRSPEVARAYLSLAQDAKAQAQIVLAVCALLPSIIAGVATMTILPIGIWLITQVFAVGVPAFMAVLNTDRVALLRELTLAYRERVIELC